MWICTIWLTGYLLPISTKMVEDLVNTKRPSYVAAVRFVCNCYIYLNLFVLIRKKIIYAISIFACYSFFTYSVYNVTSFPEKIIIRWQNVVFFTVSILIDITKSFGCSCLHVVGYNFLKSKLSEKLKRDFEICEDCPLRFYDEMNSSR